MSAQAKVGLSARALEGPSAEAKAAWMDRATARHLAPVRALPSASAMARGSVPKSATRKEIKLARWREALSARALEGPSAEVKVTKSGVMSATRKGLLTDYKSVEHWARGLEVPSASATARTSGHALEQPWVHTLEPVSAAELAQDSVLESEVVSSLALDLVPMLGRMSDNP